MQDRIINRFLRYAKIDTQSKVNSETFPSTTNQFELAQLLAGELGELGLQNIQLDKHCYLMATLESNCGVSSPKIGFIAHLDTSPEESGANVKPRIWENYPGGDIVLDPEQQVIIRESEDRELKECIGQTIITSDGSTLLGADDKAGITAIMTMLEILHENPEIRHTEIKVAFTPDEEVGQGTDYFDLERFGADFAYTVDGGMTGELNKETFSADTANIEVLGRNIHPGVAKGIMLNAIRIISEIITRLPRSMSPEATQGYEPFIHPINLHASVGSATLQLLLRDFELQGLEEQKNKLQAIIEEVGAIYPKSTISLHLEESYRNMRDELEKYPQVTERLMQAAKDAGANPYWKPIRGGTDGARLTARGLPTPNIFTGGSNFHSKTEWLSVKGLEKAVQTLINLVQV